MKAYKVFNSNWTCRGYQYEVGQKYTMEGKPELCERGFHACLKLSDCFNYYNFNPRNKVAEVDIFGFIKGHTGDKLVGTGIAIVCELSWHEVLDLANSGHSNSGHRNSGDRNSGDSNSGDSNSGHSNSGHRNSGDSNSGHRNSGHSNSGHRNSGHRNSGDSNSGHSNSGHRNSGDWNSGDRNSGDSNSGHRNSGDWNSGDWNSGHRNSGDWNSGHRNSGDWNSGDWNSGDWNSGNFNTITPTVWFFNEDTGKTLNELNLSIPSCLYFNQKENETYKEAATRSIFGASEEEKKMIHNLPNYNPDIFEEIFGIRI